jgi:hypothetical protein
VDNRFEVVGRWKTRRRQAREGVEVGVEVDIKVPGTRVELVVVSAGPESG